LVVDDEELLVADRVEVKPVAFIQETPLDFCRQFVGVLTKLEVEVVLKQFSKLNPEQPPLC
jgi:hypothetical protein